MRGWWLVLLASCGGEAPSPASAPTATVEDRAAADPALGITTELDGAAPAFGDGVLAELMGDEAAARAAYDRVLASSVPAVVAARAALYLSQLEVRGGRTRHALDLIARATALAPADAVVIAGAAALQADVVAAAAGEGDLRGPALGTVVSGVSGEIAERFAEAERALGRAHRARLRIVIEALTKSITHKIDLTLGVVAQYRAVAERTTNSAARIAASYRAGSAYHDLALELVFADLPPELEKSAADGLRGTLRALAITYLKKAVAEYRVAIEVGAVPAGAELWRFAAETDVRNAVDVLRAAGVRVPDK